MLSIDTLLAQRTFFGVEESTSEQMKDIRSRACLQPGVKWTREVRRVVRDNPACYHVTLDESLGRDIFISSPAMSEETGRMWAVAYVSMNAPAPFDKQSYRVVPLYHSFSHGLWKILPQLNIIGPDNKLNYNKGYSECSITLPLALQLAFSSIIKKHKVSSVIVSEHEELAPDYIKREGYFGETEGKVLVEPHVEAEDLRVVPQYEPDFSSVRGPLQNYTKKYGWVPLHVVLSKDNSLLWIFADSSRRNRSWIANLEHLSPLTSTGTTQEYAKLFHGLNVTPLDHGSNIGLKTNSYKKSDFCNRIRYVQEFRKTVLGKE